MKLVLVESPAKCKKIQSYLGAGYTVRATMGHFTEIKGNLAGINLRTFDIQYIVSKAKKKTFHTLQTLARQASCVYLATDPDREGEAIAYHLCIFLKLPVETTPRSRFHEITKAAIVNAVNHPTTINMGMVRAQQARQVLDIYIGFKISPFLWKAVGPRLSAGRCQSPALQMVYDKEQKIRDVSTLDKTFTVVFYFDHGSRISRQPQSGCAELTGRFASRLVPDLTTFDNCVSFLKHVKRSQKYVVDNVDKKQRRRTAPLPFITSTVQQASHGLGAGQCMSVLQSLYEKGKITYMRTDNPCLSQTAREQCRLYITETWGATLYKDRDHRPTKAATNAQEAHEAIRPTDMTVVSLPDVYSSTEKRMYDIIWKRTVASQMIDHVYDEHTTTVSCRPFIFHHVHCSTIEPGWRRVYSDTQDNDTAFVAPPVGTSLVFNGGTLTEEFEANGTRHSEPSLIKALETHGIGRPSTYSYLCETLKKRSYAEIRNVEGVQAERRRITVDPKYTCTVATEMITLSRELKKFVVTDTGKLVTEYLKTHFPLIMRYEYTREMEDDLDTIAHDATLYVPVVKKHIDTVNALIQQVAS